MSSPRLRALGAVAAAGLVAFLATPLPVHACTSASCSIAILPVTSQITATANGNWNAATTWDLGRIPAAGDNVVIPSDKTVTWNNNYQMSATATPIRSIRIDGRLHFAYNSNARLVVDTIVVSDTGTLTIADAAQPVDGAKSVEIIFAGGDLDPSLDSTLKGRGLVSHGIVQVYGQDCSPYIALAPGATAISTDRKTVTLASAPLNWKVGQQVLVTGDARVAKTVNFDHTLDNYITKDEVRTITNISGASVTLDAALTDGFHDRPFPGMPIFVAPLERNVTFRTAAANTTTLARRGHVMFMTNPNVIVQGAAFIDLGRSSKDDPLTEIAASTTATRTMKGRYPIHIHQIGQAQTTPVRIKRCVVRNSPGWGIALHSSYGEIVENVTYNIFASHIVAEEGDERGLVEGNLAVKSVGDRQRIAKTFSTTDTNNIAFQDDGQRGHGFWFQSRNLIVKNNYAVSHPESGFIYFHRNVNTTTRIPVANLANPYASVLASQGYTEFSRDDVPIALCENNVSVGCGKGFEVIKANPSQGHDIRNIFTGIDNYECSTGIEIQYTGVYTFRDCKQYQSGTQSPSAAAFLQGNRVIDTAYVNFVASGWSRTFIIDETFPAGDGLLDDGGNGQDVSNMLFVGGQVRQYGEANYFPFSLSSHVWKNQDEPVNGGTHWYVSTVHTTAAYNANMDMTSAYIPPAPVMDADSLKSPVGGLPANLWTNQRLLTTGVKTDSAGEAPRDANWQDTFSFERLWSGARLRDWVTNHSYTRSGKRYIMVADHASDRVNGHVRTFSYEVEITPYVP